MNRLITMLIVGAAACAVAAPESERPWKLHDPDARAHRVETLNREAKARRAAAQLHVRRQGWAPSGRTANGGRYEVMSLKDGRPQVNVTDNANAAITTAADLIRNTSPYSVSGSNIAVGVWDGGAVRPTHVEFGGRSSTEDGSSPIDHATHVAGTMAAAGVSASAMGMAPHAQIHSYDWVSDASEMTARAMSTPGEPDTIQVSNHSYSFIAGWNYNSSPPRWYGTWGLGQESDFFGRYSDSAAEWDAVCYNAPYFLPFKSAGNDRTDNAPGNGSSFAYFDPGLTTTNYDASVHPLSDGADGGGYDTIPVRGVSKNIMTVGAVSDAVLFGNRNAGEANMASFSGWGPADDGRIKPDIVANGLGLTSPTAGHDSAYGSLSGTSMSSPNAAGSAALLAEYYTRVFPGSYMRAATLKGLIIHSADDLGPAGPDYQFGWGLMHTKRAADLVGFHRDLPEAHAIVESSVISNGAPTSLEIQWDGASALRVTLCWTDPPGPALSGLDNATPALVHDLDLRVINPDGETNFPFRLDGTDPSALATLGDNDVDNVEQIYLPAPAVTGLYTVVVSSEGPLGTLAQDYSLLISGSTAEPVVAHTPALNTTNLVLDVPVYAGVTPGFVVDTGTVVMVWNTNGSSTAFTTNTMSLLSNNVYCAMIPAQALWTEVFYFVSAQSDLGSETRFPSNAPASLLSYQTVPPVTLEILGSPMAIDTVAPAYGTNSFPLNVPVSLSAPSATAATNGMRYALTGWTGSGAAPASGSSNTVGFVIATNSTLTWQWSLQHALLQTSSLAGVSSTTTWWFANSTGSTETADAIVQDGGTNYHFVAWFEGAQRQPDATNRAVNPAAAFLMSTARTARAHYEAAGVDGDGDGLDDWWERHYYGNTNGVPSDDTDLDGFPDGLEFADGSDPRDAGSLPASPVIVHTPLADPQAHPAPFAIVATVTDNFAVASATLKWRRDPLPFQSITMSTSSTPNVYTAEIPAPGTNAASFTYLIEASDAAGFEGFAGAYMFGVAYPISVVQTSAPLSVLLRPDTSTNLTIALSNVGNADYVWTSTFQVTGLSEDFETENPAWTHSGTPDDWHRSMEAFVSTSNAWYCGDSASGLYANSQDARLITPPVRLGPESELSFQHWPEFEIDSGSVTWDGAIVELSNDGGGSFNSITPIGGYPYVTKPHDASPFQANVAVPCFSGTGGWREARFDLSAYAGDTVQIRFRFGSDAFVTDVGWYIDDLRITPLSGTNVWATLTPGSGTVAAPDGTNLNLHLSASNILTGDFAASIDLSGNDPLAPTNVLPILMRVRSPGALSVEAAQTSTDGSGGVTITSSVFDVDGDTLELAVDVSLDSGLTWTNAALTGVNAETGSPVISNAEPRQISGVNTSAGLPATSNTLSIVWDSQDAPAVILNSNVWVRVRSWDPLFAVAATSAPFRVDNEAPSTPAGVTSATHGVSTWSSNTTLALTWGASDDGDGVGLAGYAHVFTSDGSSPDPNGTITVSNAAASITFVGESANIRVGVQAVDAHGNASPATLAGAYRMDGVPPSAAAATTDVMRSLFGDYVVGTNAVLAWSGFSDTGSGIDGYYFGSTNGGGGSGGIFTTGSTGVLSVAAPATNHVFVWARDAVGHIGSAVTHSFRSLDPSADDDGDGLNAAAEEWAGTDALDLTSRFTVRSTATGTWVHVAWPWLSNRTYVVHATAAPGAAAILSVTNPPYVLSGTEAVWTTDPAGTSVFFRVEILPAP